MLWSGTKCYSIFGLAQNIWSGTKFKRSFDILKTARIGLAVKKRELFIPCHCMEGGVVLTIDPRRVWLRSVWRFEIQFVIVPLDKVLNVEKMLGTIHMLCQQKAGLKNVSFC